MHDSHSEASSLCVAHAAVAASHRLKSALYINEECEMFFVGDN